MPIEESPLINKDKSNPEETKQEDKKEVIEIPSNIQLQEREIKNKTQIKAEVKPILNLNDIETKENESEDGEELNFEDQDFEMEDLKKAINVYAKKLHDDKKVGESNLLKKEFSYSKLELTLKIESPVEEARYVDIKSDFLLFLRKTLKNKSLQLGFEKVEIEKKKMIYTPKEKFEYLSKKNPALNELKDRFGLEFEF